MSYPSPIQDASMVSGMAMWSRPKKLAGYQNYVDECSAGITKLYAQELDDDINYLFNAINTPIQWSQITGVPAAFPPNGPAGGDLAGAYPNPVLSTAIKSSIPPAPTLSVASYVVSVKPDGSGVQYTQAPPAALVPGEITTQYLADGSVTDAKIVSVAYNKITGTPGILWAVSGSALTPASVSQQTILLTPPTTGVDALVAGPGTGTTNTRLTQITDGWRLSQNRSNASAPDDATKPVWSLTSSGDAFTIYRAPPNAIITADVALSVGAGGGLLTQAWVSGGFADVFSGQLKGYQPKVHIAHAGSSAHLRWNSTSIGPPDNVLDDVSQAAWKMDMGGSDALTVYQAPAGPTAVWANLFRIFNTGSVTMQGIANSQAALNMWGFANAAFGVQINAISGRGTPAAPTPVLTNDQLFTILAGGYYSTSYVSGQAVIQFNATENWSTTGHGTNIKLQTTPTGTTGLTSSFLFANNGDITISGSNATKTTGTAWINPSDIRLKQNIAPYGAGLDSICRLETITYELRSEPGRTCYGLEAEKVRDIFPECVGSMRMQLEGEEEDVLTLDIHPILIALINAVKELASR